MPSDQDINQYREIDDLLAPIMFTLAILFLIILAGLIVTWVDIPRVAELSLLESGDAPLSGDAFSHLAAADRVGRNLFNALLLLWPIFVGESLYQLINARVVNQTKKQIRLRIAAAILPPLRLGTPSASWNGRLWLPVMSWVYPGKPTSLTLSRLFGRPMILIALLILPILLMEFGLKSVIANHFWLQIVIHLATGFIWFAFAVEFILMMSVTDKKLRYIKKNWIDLAIILLPLISFLRGIRALRLAKLAKVQQLAKMGRIYRMRGLGMKLFRALLLFEVVNRLLRVTPAKQLAKLERMREEHIEELKEMESDIAKLKQSIAKTSSTSITGTTPMIRTDITRKGHDACPDAQFHHQNNQLRRS